MLLRNSFISCLKGALLGDCIGERFEFEYMIPNKENACKKIDHIEKGINYSNIYSNHYYIVYAFLTVYVYYNKILNIYI